MASDHVTFDAASTDDTNALATNYDWTHVVGGGAYRILIVAIGEDAASVSSVVWDYGGDNTALTQLSNLSSGDVQLDIWYLINPKAGSFGIRVVMSGDCYASCGAVSYENVAQTIAAAITEQDSTTGSSATWSNATTIAEGNLAIGINGYEGDAGVSPVVNTGTGRVAVVNTGGAVETRTPLTMVENNGTGSVSIELTQDPLSGHDYILNAFELNWAYPSTGSRAIIIT